MRDQLLALAESCPGDDSADCPIIDIFPAAVITGAKPR